MDDELIETYENMAKNHKPDKITTLFVGESPPEPDEGSEKPPYIYNPDATNKNRLWNELNKALDINEEKKEDFLEKFEEKGYFLIDIYPTYKAMKKVKEGSSEDEEYIELKAEVIKRFSKKISDLDFERIVFIHKGGTKELSLPYPGYGNQEKFRREINKIIY